MWCVYRKLGGMGLLSNGCETYGRCLAVKGGVFTITIVVMHAPNDEVLCASFFDCLAVRVAQWPCPFVIGDFNITPTHLDVREGVVLKPNMGRAALLRMMRSCHLTDQWRDHNPGVSIFSRTPCMFYFYFSLQLSRFLFYLHLLKT
uniref:Endonuclease/exonuclease/phosphatase domain-containing protein n=1 Tax=Paramormyrops kingsleyae TaxID=1676925 RepID=A0A3B3QNK5_9TELE